MALLRRHLIGWHVISEIFQRCKSKKVNQICKMRVTLCNAVCLIQFNKVRRPRNSSNNSQYCSSILRERKYCALQHSTVRYIRFVTWTIGVRRILMIGHGDRLLDIDHENRVWLSALVCEREMQIKRERVRETQREKRERGKVF